MSTVILTLPVDVALSALVAWDIYLADREHSNRQALEACQTEEQRVAYGHRSDEESLREQRAQRDVYAKAYRGAPVQATP